MSKPLEIYFEQTPNPDSLKLVTSKLLLPNIIIDRRLEKTPLTAHWLQVF